MAKEPAPQLKTIDPAAAQMIKRAETLGYPTAFSRAAKMAPCPIGAEGACCQMCDMGPCRLTPTKANPDPVGICGATRATVAARNMARHIAAGAAAHSDHGRDMIFTLEAIAEDEAQGYELRDVAKLRTIATYFGIKTDGREPREIAADISKAALTDVSGQKGELKYIARAPKKRVELWRGLGVIPRGVDREVVDMLHRTHMGDDQDPEHLLMGAVRTALADGWGGSMMATDISDVLFGTPSPLVTQVNLGVLKTDEVNVVIHGHEPTLSEMIVKAADDPELIAYAKTKGAKGINLAGICCTANETLMRQGVPSAGNFLNQELAVMTGAVEAMVVDVQCIMQALGDLSKRFHTKFITTSPKVKITGATHIEFDEHHAYDIAKDIVKLAIDNYPNRGSVEIPSSMSDCVPGFSHEYIRYMQGGMFRGSFRPLNDAVMSGRLRGVAGVVGCNNPRTTHDGGHNYIVRELLKNDVLVVQTGCGALANAKYGILTGEAALELSGRGLREVCEAIGIPPVLHMGSCVDNSRILTVLTEMATEGGLGDDISDIPGVGIAPEWMSEKALSIGAYFAASGVYVLFGVSSPIESSDEVTQIMSEGWEKTFGGKMEFVPDPAEIVRRSLAHIDAKRAALKLPPYDPSKWGQSGDETMQRLLAKKAEERRAALYGFIHSHDHDGHDGHEHDGHNGHEHTD
ncbi:MAG: anaerobic carbon-monoxide dehydrogenase catalytic subunit [Chloroflexi bacterium]|nr:anaerobic carbon-monoxide dehydrogenase catalytic subunit [Chloroflexota bacterium]